MKHILSIIFLITSFYTKAQSSTEKIIEGSKTLLELIKVIKTPRQNTSPQNLTAASHTATSADSCAIKQRSDLCYKNSSSKVLAISIYRRNGDVYDNLPFTMKVIAQKQECWYELRAGIYKYKIEADSDLGKTLLNEGEFKLEACENMIREITE
ncbi:MAG: hypothetical protein IPO46_06480 [Chitinophagaceae bacterium]|jgi:hypothetical protein|nr:hypothetical protein [Chitinophagaceae bacterium]MBP7717252.1 hypothetical protein [Ferruginibacter sp.]MBK7089031.1 hypothetical protein [Chitinophagaceae bacterium]MBK7347805.1 hypothetical protein [Chitinophagaceae bacterium]MBK8775103.1 hypothetical protein [Chitinophagaceae bacterium]